MPNYLVQRAYALMRQAHRMQSLALSHGRRSASPLIADAERRAAAARGENAPAVPLALSHAPGCTCSPLIRDAERRAAEAAKARR